ncbi:MAG TPA: cytochrome c peroxidase [Pyrinomonadaceae bacterium]
MTHPTDIHRASGHTHGLKLAVVLVALAACGATFLARGAAARAGNGNSGLDAALGAVLAQHGFTGRVGQSVEARLGRKVDGRLADLGRLAFHDSLLALSDDNSCAGCHSAPLGFGDSQSIAIGVSNNGVVGPDRAGPRNQRRTPMILNNVFYPRLMWNSRFAAVSGDPFDNSAGFQFPAPEGFSLSGLPHLLTAQAFIPPTERPEMAGFAASVPATGDGIRADVVARLNASAEYRALFGRVFPEVKTGAPVTYEMLARAVAEFEFTLAFADAPVDRFARGRRGAMSEDEKRGALLFFGPAGCVQCHAVSGVSNEMFSDFGQHVAGVPQLAPASANVAFDGPGGNEDFGLEQVTGNPADRYAFRTSPLRNVALQPAFFHNGAFTRLEDALRFHLDAASGAARYDPAGAGVDEDLRGPLGPTQPVLDRLDPLLRTPVALTEEEFRQLLAFVRDGLRDPRATPARLRKLIPDGLPSGRPVQQFQ